MKKLLSILVCGIVLVTLTAMTAFAENFTYKVYNPRTNKAYNAVLGTTSVSDTQFLWCFYEKDGKPLCVIKGSTIKKSQGLVSGQGWDAYIFIRFISGERNLDLSKYELSWRELSADTLYREMNSIRRERAAQGKHELGYEQGY